MTAENINAAIDALIEHHCHLVAAGKHPQEEKMFRKWTRQAGQGRNRRKRAEERELPVY